MSEIQPPVPELFEGDATVSDVMTSWNPSLSGDIDIKIDRKGHWYHEGGRIHREGLVSLFSGILWRENNEYFLKTPVEKFRIHVDDLPFCVTGFERVLRDGSSYIVFSLTSGESVRLDGDHPLVVAYTDKGEPRPSILVRRNLAARIPSAVFYQLIDQADSETLLNVTTLSISSGTDVFELGKFENDA